MYSKDFFHTGIYKLLKNAFFHGLTHSLKWENAVVYQSIAFIFNTPESKVQGQERFWHFPPVVLQIIDNNQKMMDI